MTDHKSPPGFMAEAESLLTVSAGASQDRMRNAPAARAMLRKLHTETSVFNVKEPPPERYLFIMVRARGALSDLVHVSELSESRAFLQIPPGVPSRKTPFRHVCDCV